MLALQTSDSDSNVSGSNHVHVIGTITYGESSFLWVTSTHHANDLRFLLGADTAGENNICTFAEVNKLFDQIIVLLNGV